MIKEEMQARIEWAMQRYEVEQMRSKKRQKYGQEMSNGGRFRVRVPGRLISKRMSRPWAEGEDANC